jgi:thiol-disulfide isomerase/thioredoxin
MFYLLVAFLLLVFIFTGLFAYNKYIKKDLKEKPFKDVANSNTKGEELQILFFHVDWCPHCKTAMPEWESFKNSFDGKQVNGYNIVCLGVNCTEENSKITKTINKYDIDSFPTVKMNRGGNIIEYDARITLNNLEEFVKSFTEK